MTKTAYFSTELSAGSQLEEDSTVSLLILFLGVTIFEAKLT